MADMRDGICPKCGSMDVYTDVDQRPTTQIHIGAWASAGLTAFLCSNCGYVEHYLLDAALRERFAGNWARADGRDEHDEKPKRKNDEL